MSDKNSIEKKLPAPWVLLLVAFGLPTAAASQLSDWALANAWSALGLLVSWWALVGVGNFALKVWAKREPVVLTWFDEWLDRVWLRVFSPSRRAYLDYVADKCLRLRREGIVSRRAWSFRLDEVFVDLRLVPRVEGEAGTAIVPSGPKSISGGRHSLWTLLDRDPEHPLRLAVLGGPGTGKTTLLEHVALRLAAEKGQPIPRRLRRHVPILIALRAHGARIADKPDTPPSALVQSELPDKAKLGRTVAWLDQQLDRGRAIVMIDGLDELADPTTRRKVVAWVGQQIRAYRRCSFLLTSRPGGYRDNPLDAVDLVTEVQRFSASQVHQFAHRWFFADTLREEQSLLVGLSQKPSEAQLEQRVRARAGPCRGVPGAAQELARARRLRRQPASLAHDGRGARSGRDARGAPR